jgi:hypothetical protein
MPAPVLAAPPIAHPNALGGCAQMGCKSGGAHVAPCSRASPGPCLYGHPPPGPIRQTGEGAHGSPSSAVRPVSRAQGRGGGGNGGGTFSAPRSPGKEGTAGGIVRGSNLIQYMVQGGLSVKKAQDIPQTPSGPAFTPRIVTIPMRGKFRA